MKKTEKAPSLKSTTVFVVDFVNKQVLLKEVLSNKPGKKEDEAIARVLTCIEQSTVQVKKEIAKAA